MKINANLEIVNNLAVKTGYKAASRSYYSQLSLAKDQNSNKYFLIINNTKKTVADKYRLLNNVEKIHCKFVNEGKATITLKDPNFHLILQKADPNQLKSFLKTISLAATSENLNTELSKIENTAATTQTNQQIKKPVTSLIIKSRSEYATNFRAIISQNLKVKSNLENKSTLHLTKLVINNCELKHINAAIFQLEYLNNLDLSNNKLEFIDNFSIETLTDLNLSHNELKYIGKNCKLPRLINLVLNNNKLTYLDHSFCKNFNNISKLILNNNQMKHLNNKIGFYFTRLKHFEANENQLDALPFSFSYLRLEALELLNNPFQFIPAITKLNENRSKFPRLVELASRTVVDKRVNFLPKDIPRELNDYIDKSFKCICGFSCFEYQFNSIQICSLSQIAKTFSCFSINGMDNQIPLLINLCSLKCFIKNRKFNILSIN